MSRSTLLTLDAVINLTLGALLVVFPDPVVSALGIPGTDVTFYPSILGAVLVGIGIALVVERVRGATGLGLVGAVSINLTAGLVLAAWLAFGSLALPVGAGYSSGQWSRSSLASVLSSSRPIPATTPLTASDARLQRSQVGLADRTSPQWQRHTPYAGGRCCCPVSDLSSMRRNWSALGGAWAATSLLKKAYISRLPRCGVSLATQSANTSLE